MLTAQVNSTAPKDPPATHETKAALEPSHHSQRPPIYGLPPEVLHLVFLPGAGFYHGHYTQLFRSRMACKYWAEVIDSTPELWKFISNRFHPELQAMIIRNSGNQLLDMVYDETCWKGDPEKEDKMAAFAYLMKPSATRWRTLAYCQADDSEGDTWPLSLPLYNLKRIHIDGLAWSDERPTLDAPKLRYVDIRRCSVNLGSLSGLQILILEFTSSTLNELMDILRASPGLQELSLNQMILEIGTEGLPNPHMSKIHLPQLRNLYISGALAESSSFLLDRIEAPNLEIVNAFVDGPSDAAVHTQLCEAAGRHLGAFPLPKKQKAQVTILIRGSELSLAIGERIINIYNPTWAWDGANGTQAILSSIYTAIDHLDSRTCEEVTILDIECQHDEETGECLRIAHSRFPRIDHILVEDERADDALVGSVVQHLSSVSQLGSTEEWLLPKLAKLRLQLYVGSTSRAIGNRIVELVKRRKEAEQTREITELEIGITYGNMDPSAVEILSQSVTKFHIIEG
ncbi:hypothetical protein FRC00_014457 [Tulasnella sp. 408]|nr:hypothetical protein FRC00_014457 [Tulasnella sp. 408]